MDKETKDKGLLKLIISDAVQEEMAEDMIAKEDIEAVIEYAERTQRKLIDDAGICIGHKRLGIPTIWVEYRIIAEKEYEIVDVYSHRIQIMEPE